MSFNNTIDEKFKFQDLPGVPDNKKLTATEFNQLVDFQKSPVQQISGSLDDTDIVIDGTKNYANTITVAGDTRTITANASGHKQGNNIKQRYTFDVDCTITLSGFDATGNNTGVIAPISAGTYDFIYQSNRNGINLIVLENIWKVNGSNIYFVGGNAGFGIAIPLAKIDVVGENTLRLTNNDTNETDKVFRIFSPHYLNAEENVLAIIGSNLSTGGRIFIGGGDGGFNSVNEIGFLTGDGSAVLGGTVRMTINGDGSIDINEELHVGGNILSDGQITVQGKVVSFTATPTFDFDDGNVQEMILTSNVTSLTLSNKLNAGNYLIYLIQDGTGGHTIPTPDATWGTATDNSVDPSNFLTGSNDRNLINVAVSPSGFAEYSIETHNI